MVSPAGVLNVHHELGLDRRAIEALADHGYAPGDVGACIASGSFAPPAMVIAPCSMKTLGRGRARPVRQPADPRRRRHAQGARPLVLMVRETPFNLAHLRNMTAVTEMGGIVFPPLPAFYHRPKSIDEMVDDTVERVLQSLRVPGAMPRRWDGLRGASAA